MEIGEIIDRISYFRTRAHLSARKLSLEVGKNPSYIHLLENKRNFEPSLSTLLDILEVCNVTPEEFFSENLEEYATDRKTLAFLRTLSEGQKQAIMNLYK